MSSNSKTRRDKVKKSSGGGRRSAANRIKVTYDKIVAGVSKDTVVISRLNRDFVNAYSIAMNTVNAKVNDLSEEDKGAYISSMAVAQGVVKKLATSIKELVDKAAVRPKFSPATGLKPIRAWELEIASVVAQIDQDQVGDTLLLLATITDDLNTKDTTNE